MNIIITSIITVCLFPRLFVLCFFVFIYMVCGSERLCFNYPKLFHVHKRRKVCTLLFFCFLWPYLRNRGPILVTQGHGMAVWGQTRCLAYILPTYPGLIVLHSDKLKLLILKRPVKVNITRIFQSLSSSKLYVYWKPQRAWWLRLKSISSSEELFSFICTATLT